MRRRDIFNIFLKGSTMDTSVLSNTEPPLNLATYFKKDETIPTQQDWKISGDDNKLIRPEISTDYEFSIVLNLNPSNNLPAVCKIGVKGDEKQATYIEIGCNNSAKLFIGEKVAEKSLPLDKLINGCQLVLNVNPLKDGITHAKLKAVDPSGLTLSIIKSGSYQTVNWAGDIDVSNLNCDTLHIIGSKSI